MMVRIRFTSTSCVQSLDVAGAVVSWHGETGEIREVPDEIAVAMIAGGWAEEVIQSVSEAASRLSEEKANNEEASEAGRVLAAAQKKEPAKPAAPVHRRAKRR
jgi:hypothetical protein